VNGLGGSMAFLLFIGAACADATPEQSAQLRERVKPLLGTYRTDGNPRPVLETVLEVMGPDWQPTGEWRAWIDKMLKGGGQR
jgi:hypothetical protein